MGWLQNFLGPTTNRMGAKAPPPIPGQSAAGTTPPPQTYGPGDMGFQPLFRDPKGQGPNPFAPPSPSVIPAQLGAPAEASVGQAAPVALPTPPPAQAPLRDGGFHGQTPQGFTPPPMTDGGFHLGSPRPAPSASPVASSGVPLPPERPPEFNGQQTPAQSWNVYSGFGGDQGNTLIGQMQGNPGQWMKPGVTAPEASTQPPAAEGQANAGSGLNAFMAKAGPQEGSAMANIMKLFMG